MVCVDAYILYVCKHHAHTGRIPPYLICLSLVSVSVINMFVFVCVPRVISRAPGLKLVVETLITSLRPIGNIVLICCAFFIVFGILGVQVVCIDTHTHTCKIDGGPMLTIMLCHLKTKLFTLCSLNVSPVEQLHM